MISIYSGKFGYIFIPGKYIQRLAIEKQGQRQPYFRVGLFREEMEPRLAVDCFHPVGLHPHEIGVFQSREATKQEGIEDMPLAFVLNFQVLQPFKFLRSKSLKVSLLTFNYKLAERVIVGFNYTVIDGLVHDGSELAHMFAYSIGTFPALKCCSNDFRKLYERSLKSRPCLNLHTALTVLFKFSLVFSLRSDSLIIFFENALKVISGTSLPQLFIIASVGVVPRFHNSISTFCKSRINCHNIRLSPSACG